MKATSLLAAFLGAALFWAATPSVAKNDDDTKEDIRVAIAEAKEAARAAATEARDAVRTWSWTWSDDEDSGSQGPEPYVGVSIESVPRALRRYVDLPKGVGLLLVKIHKDSPAMKAGLEDDDIMVEFNGQMIVNFDQFSTLVNLLKKGDSVPVVVIRKGNRETVQLIIEERVRQGNRWIVAPEAPEAPEPPEPGEIGGVAPLADGDVVVHSFASKIPGSVRIVAGDGGEITEIDLSQLKSNLGNLEEHLRDLKVDQNGKRIEIHKLMEHLGDLDTVVVGSEAEGPRQSIVHMGETTLSLSNDEGKVRIFEEGDARNALVTTRDGVVIFDGEIPADLDASELDPRAKRLIRSLLDLSRDADLDLENAENLPVELEISDAKKLTRA